MDKYDVGIIGAGIAGSCLAILLAKQGKSVVVFEKDLYPKHKVCGEFVSLESYEFFKQLGLPLDKWNLPKINKLLLTSERGTSFYHDLKIGGFGISRAKLDHELTKLFEPNQIAFYSNNKVLSCSNGIIKSKEHTISAKQVIGAHGKYAPSYVNSNKTSIKNNFIGVKYHIKGDFDAAQIVLHSFSGGYCGMSKIENETYCLCYLCDARLLRAHSNSVEDLEKEVLFKNRNLKQIFSKASFIWDKPLIISNIKFQKQQLFTEDILFVGDAAGSISPLSGNGMSIAARTSLLLSELLEQSLTLKYLKAQYESAWDKNFGAKVNQAKTLNRIMLNPIMHDLTLKTFKALPFIGNKIVSSMQGKPFSVRNSK